LYVKECINILVISADLKELPLRPLFYLCTLKQSIYAIVKNALYRNAQIFRRKLIIETRRSNHLAIKLDSCIVNLRRNVLQKSERPDAVIPENGFKYIGKCALRLDIPKKLT